MSGIEQKQIVYRVGLGHNKWIVVLPPGEGGRNLEDDLVLIQSRLIRTVGDFAITQFDYVEYLGRG